MKGWWWVGGVGEEGQVVWKFPEFHDFVTYLPLLPPSSIDLHKKIRLKMKLICILAPTPPLG